MSEPHERRGARGARGGFPRRAVVSVVGRDPVGWSEVGGGYTPARRWAVEFDDGSTAFVKSASGDEARPVRREIATLASLEGSFSPRLVGSVDEGDRAVAVLEDLSDWLWPPPYPADVSGLMSMLDAVAAHPAPDGLPRLEKPDGLVWPTLAADPTIVSRLGVATTGWVAASHERLAEVEAEFDPVGDDLVHNDIWAGNIAISDRRCVLVDWSEAKRGSRSVDRGFLYLSLRSENGPRPEARFEGDVGFASWWSAQLASRLADGPDPRLHPSIADGLLQDLRAALEWAAELLDLPSPLSRVSG